MVCFSLSPTECKGDKKVGSSTYNFYSVTGKTVK